MSDHNSYVTKAECDAFMAAARQGYIPDAGALALARAQIAAAAARGDLVFTGDTMSDETATFFFRPPNA